MDGAAARTETAVFAGGCFWCTEAVFESLRGVRSVMPGYAGGQTENPTYEQVCTGQTGHAEAIRVEYDPRAITYDDLLTVFFAAHDPTTLNRQGNDIGTQYRSAIFSMNDDQRVRAEAFIRELDAGGGGAEPVMTEVAPLKKFYEAEAYHHHYFLNNPQKAYCQLVINPKLDKVKKRFGELMK